jgi:hypothetical protein
MASRGTVVVKFTGETKGLESAVGKVDGTLGKLGSTFGKIAVAAAGAFAVDKIVAFGKASLDAYGESARVASQTEAVLKSTGNAANTTADHMGDLANRLKNLSGVSDEEIQSGENMLATFTNITNGLGPQNQIFDQATQTMLDLSVATGTDAKGAAVQLGKALNDPVKGISALTRVGVTFTQQQKDQIAALVKSGDTMGAQKIILAELNKEFGGSAKAAGDALTPLDRLKIKFDDLQEVIGGKLVGAMNTMARVAGPIIKNLGIGFSAFKAAFSGEGITSTGWVGAFERLGVAARQVWDNVKLFFNALRTGFTEDEGTPIENFALMLRENLLPVIQNIAEFIENNWKPILIGLAVTIGLVVAPVLTVAAAAVYLYERFQVVHDVVDAVVQFFATVVIPAMQAFAAGVSQRFGEVVAYVQTIWPQISEAVGHVMVVIQDVVQAALSVIQAVWHAVGDDLFHYAQAIWGFIQATVENAINAVRAVIQIVLALINGDWGKAWDGLVQLLGAVWDEIKAAVQAGIDGVKAILGGIASILSGIAGQALDWAKAVGGAIVDGIVAGLKAVGHRIADAIGSLIPHSIGIPGVGSISLPHFAQGGIMPGPLGAPGLAVLHGGERVIPNGGGFAGGGDLHLHLSIGNQRFADMVVSALVLNKKRNGSIAASI